MEPPVPLILGGWNFSSDLQKMRRWDEMKSWAINNGCPALVEGLSDSDFYWVDEPSADDGCGYGLSSRLPSDNPSKERPSEETLAGYLDLLTAGWPQVAGAALADATVPIRFSGDKARCLIVAANPATKPPWGDWQERSPVESARRTLTQLRAAINRAIAPHEVDHVLFETVRWPAHTSSKAVSEP
jgi:hypothetical protein